MENKFVHRRPKKKKSFKLKILIIFYLENFFKTTQPRTFFFIGHKKKILKNKSLKK